MIINNNPCNVPLLRKKSQNPRVNRNVNFKGGKGNTFNKVLNFCDFNGYNQPLSFIMAYTFGVVLFSRIKRARDNNERREIITRDSLAISTIIFAVPALQKLSATLTRKGTGLPIGYWEGKPAKTVKEQVGGLWNVIRHHLNPAGKYHLAKYETLQQWFSKISDRGKNPLSLFCKQQIDNHGSLWKMFQYADKNTKNALNKIAEKSGMVCAREKPNFFSKFLKAKGSDPLFIPKDNDTIINMISKAEESADKGIKSHIDTIVTNLNKSSKEGNNLLKVAEFFKSVPDLMNIAIVCGLLGIAIPAFNIAHTKKILKQGNKQTPQVANNNNGDTFKSSNFTANKKDTNQSNINSDLFANFQK